MVLGTRSLRRGSVLGWVLALILATTAFATPGALDTSYDGDGIKQGLFFERGNHVVVDVRGHITVGGIAAPGRVGAGHASLVRYRPNGKLDRTFSRDGRRTLPADGSIRGLALWDGRVVVATRSALWRLKADGSLDPSFGRAGRIDFPEGRRVHGRHPLAIADDRAYVILDDPVTTGSYLFGFASDGSRSGAWRRDLAMTSVAVSNRVAYGVGDVDDRVTLARFTIGPRVRIDSSYAQGGLASGPAVEFDPSGQVTAYTSNDLAVHPESGTVTVVGDEYDCAGGDCSSFYYGFAVRFLRSGSLDATFGVSGEAKAGCTNGSIGDTAVVLQGAKTIVAGQSWDKWDDYTDRFGVTRLTASGERDPTFGQAACHTYGTEGAVVADMVFTGAVIVVAGGQFTARYLAT